MELILISSFIFSIASFLVARSKWYNWYRAFLGWLFFWIFWLIYTATKEKSPNRQAQELYKMHKSKQKDWKTKEKI